MSERRGDLCSRVVQLASAMLDGRLDAARRGALQRHLQACPACLAAVQQLARIGRATHNLPPRRAPHGMASRVRELVVERRRARFASLDEQPLRRPSARWATLLAAAAVLLLAWAIGFRMGGAGVLPAGERPAGELTDRLSASREPVRRNLPHASPPPVDATFASTCRHVLGDLAWAPELPLHARRPLMAAQFELFDLRERADHVLAHSPVGTAEHQLAQLIWGLSRALQAVESPARDESVAAVVERRGASLTAAERSDLGEFLELKRRLVVDDGVIDAEFAQVWRRRTRGRIEAGQTTSFSFATGFASASSLAESGMDQAAAELEQTVLQMLQETLGAAPQLPRE